MSVKVTKITIDIPSSVIDKIVKSNDLGLFLSMTWARYMNKFVPMNQGMLYKTADVTKPFEVSYIQNYSHYQWEGLSKSGKKLRYSKEQHHLAQSHWEEQAFIEYKSQVAKEVTEYLRGKS